MKESSKLPFGLTAETCLEDVPASRRLITTMSQPHLGLHPLASVSTGAFEPPLLGALMTIWEPAGAFMSRTVVKVKPWPPPRPTSTLLGWEMSPLGGDTLSAGPRPIGPKLSNSGCGVAARVE